MKKLSYLLALSVVFALFGCHNQKQTDQNKQESLASKSGELVFGDKKLTYFIEGEGDPCVICADGIIQANCLSERLKENFQFIFTEPRHAVYYEETKDYSDISMDTVVDDIELLRNKLGYAKIYVLGHSICGLIAIEYGRKYPQNSSGVIMVNTPPHFHKDYMDIVARNWDTNASEERKRIYEDNKENLKKMNLESLPEIERKFLEYKASVPMEWHNPLYDISSVLRGFRENTSGWNHFYELMSDYNITRSEINVPIFLSLASYDFLVPQSLWDDYIGRFPTLTVKRFEKSGHFPHVEEQELFDDQLLSWKKETELVKSEKDVEVLAQDSSPIVDSRAKFECVFAGGYFLESPAASPDGLVYFSDITYAIPFGMQAGHILRYDPRSGVTSIFRSPSGMSNGIIFDARGDMIAAEGADFGGHLPLIFSRIWEARLAGFEPVTYGSGVHTLSFLIAVIARGYRMLNGSCRFDLSTRGELDKQATLVTIWLQLS